MCVCVCVLATEVVAIVTRTELNPRAKARSIPNLRSTSLIGCNDGEREDTTGEPRSAGGSPRHSRTEGAGLHNVQSMRSFIADHLVGKEGNGVRDPNISENSRTPSQGPMVAVTHQKDSRGTSKEASRSPTGVGCYVRTCPTEGTRGCQAPAQREGKVGKRNDLVLPCRGFGGAWDATEFVVNNQWGFSQQILHESPLISRVLK